jgi:hypothetical protein
LGKHKFFKQGPAKKWMNNALVHLILNGDVDPTKILEYRCSGQYTDYNDGKKNSKGEIEHYENRFAPTATTRPGLPRPGFETPTERQIRAYDDLVLSAIESSRWISPDQKAEVFERFRTGDKDAAGVLLLPLLTNLKAVEPPLKGGLCAELFRQVANESRKRTNTINRSDVSNSARPGEAEKLPFSELLIFYLGAIKRDGVKVSFWLREIRPFLSIPSLRRIVLFGVRDWELDNWPSDMAPITCPEIYFAQSSVNRETIMEFSENIAGPCTLMQWHSTDIYFFYAQNMGNEATWDHLRVEVDERGGRNVWTSLECEGGRPGHDYPWVSWLWHGRMRDWERLDEPFYVEDGDSDADSLSGFY